MIQEKWYEENGFNVTIDVWRTWYETDESGVWRIGENHPEYGNRYAPEHVEHAEYDDRFFDRTEVIAWAQDLIQEYPDRATLNGPRYPRWYCSESECYRECLELGLRREVYVAIAGLAPFDWMIIRDGVQPIGGDWEDGSILRIDTVQPWYNREPITTILYDCYDTSDLGKPRVAFQIFEGGTEVLRDDEMWVGIGTPIDSLKVVETVWSFLDHFAHNDPWDSEFATETADWLSANAEYVCAVHAELERAM